MRALKRRRYLWPPIHYKLFLFDHIRDLYDAEKQLTKALPKLVKAAKSTELANAISAAFEQTESTSAAWKKFLRRSTPP